MKQFFDLNEFVDYAWSLLTRGVVDKKSVAKNPTFSTISEDGFPTMRTVVLRRADRHLKKIIVLVCIFGSQKLNFR
jgi:pyridoxine/pyridoxamine 5'-phosphate oxidase